MSPWPLHCSRGASHILSAFLAAPSARGVFSYFTCLVKEFDSLLGEFLSPAMFQIPDEGALVLFVFHIGLLFQDQASPTPAVRL
jgi:hypothetical protein